MRNPYKASLVRNANIRGYFKTTALQRSLPKPGRGAGDNRDGWLLLKTGHRIEELVTSNAASNKNNKDTRHRVGA
jgi:hypothetical protein